MRKTSLYIVATPWNFLNAYVMAHQRQAEEEAYLFYVDHKAGEANSFTELMQNSELSPFKDVLLFYGKAKGFLKKWWQRRQVLNEIERQVKVIQPNIIWVGSDRRIEFQKAMAVASQLKKVKGYYLDEGVFTYTCRRRSQTWLDKYADTWVKKLIYGSFWRHPPAIGASAWVSEGWVLNPDKACPILKRRIALHPLKKEWYLTKEVDALARILVDKKAWQVLEQEFEILLVLPHPVQINQELKARYNAMIAPYHDAKIAVKCHPRDDGKLEWLEAQNVYKLPFHVPLEIMLPRLKFKQMVSAPSTAVLSAQFFNPGTKIELLSSNAVFNKILNDFGDQY